MPTLAFDAEVAGVDEAVSALARVDQSAEQIAQKTTQRFGRTVQEIRDEIEWTEAIEAAKKKLNSESGKTTTAVASTGAAARSAGANVQAMASKIAGASAAVGALSGAIGATTGSRAAGLVSAMANTVAQGAAMGATFGPQGALLGGLLGVIPVIAQLASAHNSAAAAAESHATALNAARTAMTAFREASLQSDIGAGVFGSDMTPERAREEREVRRARILEIEREQQEQGDLLHRAARFTAGISDAAHTRRMEQLSQEAATARQQIETLDELSARQGRIALGTETSGIVTPGAQAGAATKRRVRRRGSGRGEAQSQADRDETARLQAAYDAEQAVAAQRAEAEQRRLDDIERNNAAEIEARQELNEEIQRIELQRFEEQQRIEQEKLEAQRELVDAAKEAQRAFGDGWTDSIDSVREAWIEANAALRQSGGTMISQSRLMERTMVATGNNIAETIGGTMKSAFESALGAWMDGSKSFVEAAEEMVKGVIKALVMESIVQAVVEFARGVAAVASQDYVSAPQHFAAGAAWAAVAGVAGGIGAGIGAFGGGGEKKDAGSGGADTRSMGAGSVREEAAAQNVTINVFPGGFTTRGEVVGGVMQAIDEAARSGYRFDGRLLRGA